MRRVLLTGMSGTGKSTLLHALQADDSITIDMDYDGWIAYDPALGEAGMDIPRVLRLFEHYPDRDVFLAGTAINQARLYPHATVIALTAPTEVLRQRILNRHNNPFGKQPEEWAQILRDKEEIEPLLIRGSHFVVDTNRPLDEIKEEILRITKR